MSSSLDDRLRELIHEAVKDAVSEALDGHARGEGDPESWRSRVHRVHEDTRITLSEAGEVLGVSERSVRRYASGESDYPLLPSRKGPGGTTIRAGDLVSWIKDIEDGHRFQVAAGGRP